MLFATTWMNIKLIIISEVIQRKTNIIWFCLHVESKKRYKWTYLHNRNRSTAMGSRIMVTKVEREEDKLGACD